MRKKKKKKKTAFAYSGMYNEEERLEAGVNNVNEVIILKRKQSDCMS